MKFKIALWFVLIWVVSMTSFGLYITAMCLIQNPSIAIVFLFVASFFYALYIVIKGA